MGKKPRSNNRPEEFSSEENTPKDTSPHVWQRDKINFDFGIRQLPWTDKQKELIEILLNKKHKLKNPTVTM